MNGCADRLLIFRGLHIHAQRKTQTFFHNGAFQKYVCPVVGNLTFDHFIGNHVDPAEIAALISQKGNFFEYGTTNIVHRAVYAAHMLNSSLKKHGSAG